MRNKFDEQLKVLSEELENMGELCEKIISLACDSLKNNTEEIRKSIIRTDCEIDSAERNIESLCLKLLLSQQPVARDLRQISAALKMITDLERIGDQAYDISEISQYLKTGGDECAFIGEMATKTIEMVNLSVEAYVKHDTILAGEVIKSDDAVDRLFCETKNSLIEMIEQRAISGEYALDLMMIAKYFERIGDHATNVAEWVEFSVTGVHDETDGVKL